MLKCCKKSKTSKEWWVSRKRLDTKTGGYEDGYLIFQVFENYVIHINTGSFDFGGLWFLRTALITWTCQGCFQLRFMQKHT
jgi:hypothetical protein